MRNSIQDLIKSPLTSVISLFLFVWATFYICSLPAAINSDPRAFWQALLASLFSIFTWFFVAAKQFPYMRVDALTDDGNCIVPVSQQGNFYVMVQFRFLNKSDTANTILKSRYWLRIGQSTRYYDVNLRVQDASLQPWLMDRIMEGKDILLDLPEVYPPHTARIRCVVFSGSIPWQRQGNEQPDAWLRSEFEMADGGSKRAEAKLTWCGNLPIPNNRQRL